MNILFAPNKNESPSRVNTALTIPYLFNLLQNISNNYPITFPNEIDEHFAECIDGDKY